MADYQTALRQRMQTISDTMDEQTTWERIRAARQKQQKAYDQQLAYQQQIVDANRRQTIGGGVGTPNPFSTIANAGIGAAKGASDLNSFINTIGRKESSNNYGAVNRQSGAMGKYQIMPSNIIGSGRGWDYEALGRDISTSEFMRSPEIQEQIARYKLQQYYNRYGPAGASIAWYAGPGAAQKYVNTGYASSGKQAGGYLGEFLHAGDYEWYGAMRNYIERIRSMTYHYLDRQDKEERLTFNVLVGRHLRDITATLAFVQVTFALLAFIDRLNPTKLATVYYVELLANDSFWAGAFMLSGVLGMVSLKMMELRSASMAIASACFLIWGVIIFFKALTAAEPVAFSVGLMGVTLGVVAYKVCLSWNIIMFNHRYFTTEDVQAKVQELDT